MSITLSLNKNKFFNQDHYIQARLNQGLKKPRFFEKCGFLVLEIFKFNEYDFSNKFHIINYWRK